MTLAALRVIAAQPQPPNSAALVDVEQRLGPFALGPYTLPPQNFTVVLQSKRIAGAQPGRDDSETLAAIEIRNGSGAVQHREPFEYLVERGAFVDTCSASVETLKGNVATGLLIATGCLPSAPGSGDTWEIFGTVNGKLLRFGKPFTTTGELEGLVQTPVVKSGTATLIRPDTLRLRVWTGNFHVTTAINVDWMQGQLGPAQRCFHQTGQGMREGGCEVPVQVERVPRDDELTFVRLFSDAAETGALPQHVVVKKESRVEFLAANVRIIWNDTGDLVTLDVDDDPWLNVRIDGKEGWIHTQEDFLALGVPQAG